MSVTRCRSVKNFLLGVAVLPRSGRLNDKHLALGLLEQLESDEEGPLELQHGPSQAGADSSRELRQVASSPGLHAPQLEHGVAYAGQLLAPRHERAERGEDGRQGPAEFLRH